MVRRSMCRFLAYCGEPVFLETLVCTPCHSLIEQSMHAAEAKTETNGDGFGVGWYSERTEPGRYCEIRPAWSDENLQSICSHVRSHLFFAHVRAATGTAVSRANCHPFKAGRFLFMHNGQVGDWPRLRRKVEAMIPDELYSARTGTTDSEAIFLAALGQGLERDSVGAFQRVLHAIRDEMRALDITSPLRFTATWTDGDRIWAVRWASDDKPPSLYWRRGDNGLIVVSEPVDSQRDQWRPVPPGGGLVARVGAAPEMFRFH